VFDKLVGVAGFEPATPLVPNEMLSQHSKMSLMRSHAGAELTTILIYEASRNLSTYKTPIETPVAPTSAVRLSNPPLLVPILRAGLGMAEPALALMPLSQ
jgi:uracil phosphoribosyltransferase